MSPITMLLLWGLLAYRSSLAPVDDADAKTSSPVAVDLATELARTHWLAGAPSHYDPTRGVAPTDSSLRHDLATIASIGATGMVSYTPFDSLAAFAEDVGLNWVLLGIWDPKSAEELGRAVAVCRGRGGDRVLAIVLGNEGLTFGRYTVSDLASAAEHLRKQTDKPLATSEIWDLYQYDADLRAVGCFWAPTAHPYFSAIRDPVEGVAWIRAVHTRLSDLTEKPVFMKECGLASAGDEGLSEASQATFFRHLLAERFPYAAFEYGDSPWKTGASVEPYLGLFRADGTPKPAVDVVRGLWLAE